MWAPWWGRTYPSPKLNEIVSTLRLWLNGKIPCIWMWRKPYWKIETRELQFSARFCHSSGRNPLVLETTWMDGSQKKECRFPVISYRKSRSKPSPYNEATSRRRSRSAGVASSVDTERDQADISSLPHQLTCLRYAVSSFTESRHFLPVWK